MRPRSAGRKQSKAGFTLIEVILVAVIIVLIGGIAIPNLSGSYRGAKLRSAASNIERIGRYGRGMSILREEPLTMVIDTERQLIYLGAAKQTATETSDGELDQEVLKRLGYIDGESSVEDPGIEKEISRPFPDGIIVDRFKTETARLGADEIIYLIHFYPNGQCEGFELTLADRADRKMQLESDPVSGKIFSYFEQ
ncbi:MAG: prepilin-type N-terminal cleavage/methylation domain-containing protein [Kiritimatiellaceae bacterium]|nr:MAG: prepilin-type N-terminal cleavage/methylation domain-containing protein [Kiritimatiellaceae bacterium]|tara:strand:- start:3054 stop:3641 length:588 start_codon:yes stop_codon:yes gene_type:complete